MAATGPEPRHHVEVDLLAEKTAAVPGSTMTVAVRERLEPGWHTYWINPGDLGEPTSIEWQLPQGLSAGPILWPIPHIIPVGPLAEYGYDDEVLLLTEIKVPEKIEGDSVTLAGKVSYLVCREICIPEEAHVELTLPVQATGPAAPPRSPGRSRRRARRCLCLCLARLLIRQTPRRPHCASRSRRTKACSRESRALDSSRLCGVRFRTRRRSQ